MEGVTESKDAATRDGSKRPGASEVSDLNCDNDATPVERVICGDDELAKLEVQLSRTYRQFLRVQNDSQIVKDDHRRWLAQRETDCRGRFVHVIKSCVLGMTKSRVNGLENVISLIERDRIKSARATDKPSIPKPSSQQSKEAPPVNMKGRCLAVVVLGMKRGSHCNVSQAKHSNGMETFLVSMTPSGRARQMDEPAGPDDILVTFSGYPTGLIGGVDPLSVSGKTLSGILRVGAGRTDPSTLQNLGKYFFIVQMTNVVQKREWFSTVREKLAPVSPNEGAVHMGWKAPGYCKGIKLQNAWNLECEVTPNPGNTNYFHFISDAPLYRAR